MHVLLTVMFFSLVQ